MQKVALITGGSSGLGYALAELLGKQGYKIIVLARNLEKINKAVADLSAQNISAKGISCDTTDENGLKNAFSKIQNEETHNDYLV